MCVKSVPFRIKVVFCQVWFTRGNDRGPTLPGKMRAHLENLEKSWNFETVNKKNHGKMIWNEKITGCVIEFLNSERK